MRSSHYLGHLWNCLRWWPSTFSLNVLVKSKWRHWDCSLSPLYATPFIWHLVRFWCSNYEYKKLLILQPFASSRIATWIIDHSNHSQVIAKLAGKWRIHIQIIAHFKLLSTFTAHIRVWCENTSSNRDWVSTQRKIKQETFKNCDPKTVIPPDTQFLTLFEFERFNYRGNCIKL